MKRRRTGVFMARAAAVLILPLLVFSYWLGQIYGVDFEIKDPAVGQYLYRGTFTNKPLDQILSVIEMSIPVKFTDLGFTQNQSLRRITALLEK